MKLAIVALTLFACDAEGTRRRPREIETPRVDYGPMWCSPGDERCYHTASECERESPRCERWLDYVCAAYEDVNGRDVACFVLSSTCEKHRQDAIASGKTVGTCVLSGAKKPGI